MYKKGWKSAYMKGINQCVMYDHLKWIVKSEGSESFTSEHNLKTDAVNNATDIALKQHSELRVYAEDGRLEYRNNYNIH